MLNQESHRLPSSEKVSSKSGSAPAPAQAGRSKAGSERDAQPGSRSAGLAVARRYTTPGVHPFDEIEWENRSAQISNERGQVVFEQTDVEVPTFWSQMATNIVVSKYFRGTIGTPEREHSVRQLIGRVSGTLARWGREGGYFATEEDAQAFEAEMTYLLLHQKVSFNSPVWFNIGIEPHPQGSACFINSVQDTMQSILELAKTEGMLFKYGSGTGSNLSTIRSSKELLAGGGTASGPVSFMKGYDAFAGVIKSGGKTRRAAKMVILNVTHPDIMEFIWSKASEEKKARVLIEAGYDASFNRQGGAYDSVFFQNANHSVRVDDEFMRAVVEDREWVTHAVTDGRPLQTYRARDIMRAIAEAAWQCGDPGMQFDTTINDWHTSPNSGRINASNPCVTGDTLVATSEGWRRIDSLVGRTGRIVGADGQPHVVDRIFSTGRKQVFRLRTLAGYEVRITADHKVWTIERGDVAVSELRTGEKLSLLGPGFGRAALSERLGLAIGVAVGDGCLTRSHSSGRIQEMVFLTMAAGEAPILERIAGALNEHKRALRAVGAVGRGDDVHVRVGSSAGGWSGAGASEGTFASTVGGAIGGQMDGAMEGVVVGGRAGGSISRLGFSSRPVVDIFKRFAVLDEGSHRKRFTPEIFELDRTSLAAVLRGLFTADGTVADYGSKSQYVSLDSTSLELLQQVQLLLLSFGIKAKLYDNRRGGTTEALLPDGRGGEKVCRVREVHSLRISCASRMIFEREIGFDEASPKAAALREMNARITAYKDELTDAVESIEPLGEEEVFDLTEDVTRHFVANGLLVHNCSEYMFLDDTACNLASLNLMKFRRPDGEFDTEGFKHAVRMTILGQEIIVSNASYPTPAIGRNSFDYRPLGLGYANLGALLMSRGVPYDSGTGRATAAAITALMCGEAYAESARIAAAIGPFSGYEKNRDSFLRVMDKHRAAADLIPDDMAPAELLGAARGAWTEAVEVGREHGYRNAQATVLAPTGTIAFMMDCDTTGIEPDISLVKYKKLVGGGVLKIINNTVPLSLRQLGYQREEIQAICDHINEHETIEGAPHLKQEDLAVFDCAFKPANGMRSIHYAGHIKMMAAVQPFLSGAISKTVNLPEAATVQDLEQAYTDGWRAGLKAIAIYRDGCKKSQPLSTGKAKEKAEARGAGEHAPVPSPSTMESAAVPPAAVASAALSTPAARPFRRRLPDERQSITHKFSIAGHEGYITVGMFEDGQPGEIFVTMAKTGSVVSGLMDSFATAISMTLQYGVPLKVLCDKFSHTRFEPSGITNNADIRFAKSIVDYIFRWLALKFLPRSEQVKYMTTTSAAADGGMEANGLEVPGAADALSNEARARNGGGSVSPAELEAQHARAIAAGHDASASSAASIEESEKRVFAAHADAPPCHECGEIMIRNGSCYACINCGATSGCS